MDLPCLIGVGFLFLAITAPHPSIAMAIDYPAVRTPDSSSGQTKVTVYWCEGCAVRACGERNFGTFAKVAETQNNTFSEGKIELVTREKSILMCFRKANGLPEGIYAIVWEKTGGAGYSCGNPNAAAFSENGRGNISTAKNKICFEADTNVWEPNPILKCCTEMPVTEATNSTTDIPGDEGIPGNPEFLTSKKRSIGISLTLVLLVVLGAAVAVRYFYKKHHYDPALGQMGVASDKEKLTHVWKPPTNEETSIQQHPPLYQSTTTS